MTGFFGPPRDGPTDLFPASRLGPYSVVDLVEVPAALPAGNYVLSFRIDCEQTPQVWNTCADIHIS